MEKSIQKWTCHMAPKQTSANIRRMLVLSNPKVYVAQTGDHVV